MRGVGYKQCPCKSIDTVRGGAMSSGDCQDEDSLYVNTVDGSALEKGVRSLSA